MNARYTHQEYPIHPAERHSRHRRQVYRRRRLGMLLIVAGSAWLWLRMIGWVGDMPLCWAEGTGAMLAHFCAGDFARPAPRAACGMLLADTSGRE